MKKLILILILFSCIINAQESKSYLLLISVTKQNTTIDKIKSNIYALCLDENGKLSAKNELLNVVFEGYSDQHYDQCLKCDSIPITENYSTDTFKISDSLGLRNKHFLEEKLVFKKKLFRLKFQSSMPFTTDYFYLIVTSEACIGKLDSKSSNQLMNRSILLIKNLWSISDSILDESEKDKVIAYLLKK